MGASRSPRCSVELRLNLRHNCGVPFPRLLVATLILACASLAAAAEERLLTKAIEVRSLTPAEAESGIPVRLRGIVVFVEGISSIFIQDETSTTFFRVRVPPQLPKVGDEIEIETKTRMGLYLPGLDYSVVRVLGRKPLPPGIPVQYDDLHFGRYHYRRVTVEGVVRSVVPLVDARNKRSRVRLALGSRVIEVRVEALPQAQSLVDCKVRISGLAGGMINTVRRQLVAPALHVPDWNDVEVIAPAPAPAELPHISAEELLAFRLEGLGERRIRTEGIVTAVFPDGGAYLRQGELAFAVRFIHAPALLPGDQVKLVGFPSMEQFSASLLDAEILEKSPGPRLGPIDVKTFDELYTGQHDSRLVRVIATLRDSFKTETGITLLAQQGERVIPVRISASDDPPPAGARVRITAICQVEGATFNSGFASRPTLISLRAAAPSDIELLNPPSWWTPRRLTTVLAALAGAVLLAGLWIAMLRRQVTRQTDALRQRIESEAALEERQRIAREFHDTLEQELAGVSLRLDALATRPLDDKGLSLTTATRNLVSRIQTETRDLISDLRDPAELAGDLGAALQAVASRQSADRGVEVAFVPLTELPTLPTAAVHDLRMIARESVTNAVKHGHASRILIETALERDKVALRIVDNGMGFDPGASLDKRGHFGCAGIRERARKLGAAVTWHSRPGHGATVQLALPLSALQPTPAAAPAV